MIGRHSEHQRTKSFFSRSVTHALRLSAVSMPFLVNCASIRAPYMRFVIKVRLTFYVLEYSLSITSIILHTYHPKCEISCKSCYSVKSTYRSFASLNLVKISAILLTNNMHNICKCQKEYVPAFYKII